MKFVLESIKKTKTNLQKYFHPSTFNQPKYAHAHLRNAESQKRSAKVPILKKTTGLCPSRSCYSPGPPRGDPGAGCELAHATAAGPGEAQDHHRQDRLLRANSESAV